MWIISTRLRGGGVGGWGEPHRILWPSVMRQTDSWGKLLEQAHNCGRLGDWLKGLICMPLSSPTNSQEAPVDKVTSVSLPVCQPGMKTDQTADSRLGQCRRSPCSWSCARWWPQIHVRGDGHPGSPTQGQETKLHLNHLRPHMAGCICCFAMETPSSQTQILHLLHRLQLVTGAVCSI